MKKHITALLAAGILMASMPLMAFATEAPIDEADIYEDGAVTVANLENAPALKGGNKGTMETRIEKQESDGMVVTTDGTQETTIKKISEAPNTGAPSMMLPIGTALLALSTIPLVLRKKN